MLRRQQMRVHHVIMSLECNLTIFDALKSSILTIFVNNYKIFCYFKHKLVNYYYCITFFFSQKLLFLTAANI